MKRIFTFLIVFCFPLFSFSQFGKVAIGTSGNIWGSVDERCKPICYHPDLELLTYVFRADPDTYPDALSNGSIMGTYSLDAGETWSEPCYIFNPYIVDFNPRFPSGVIYNPVGNIDPMQSYFLCAGPSYLNAIWNKIYFVTTKLDCSEQNIQYISLENFNQTYGLTTCNDGTAHLNSITHSAENILSLYSFIGNWQEDHFTWDSISFQTEMSLNSEGIPNWRGLYLGGDKGFNACWKKDGSIGYIVLIAQDIDLMGGFEPIIFKSVDQGYTWEEVEIDFSGFQENFQGFVPPSSSGTIYPSFEETACIVDSEGNLQLFASIKGHQSIHPDSLNYTYPDDYGNLYNIAFDQNEIEYVIWVDSLRTKVVLNDDENSYDNVGWNHRLNITKINNEEYLMFSWSDTWNEEYEVNAQPDIFGNTRSIYNNLLEYDQSIQYTIMGDILPGYNFFTFAAEFGSLRWGYSPSIPFSQTLSPPEFFNDDNLNPVTHYFLDQLFFVNIKEQLPEKKQFNYIITPNPATNNIELFITDEPNQTYQINIFDITGSIVFKETETTDGNNEDYQKIDISALCSGIYFISVNNGTLRQTQKLIIN